MSKVLKKAAIFTDIHFGKRNNSEEHNQDCLNYIDWFCEQVEADPSIDHIWFLGDWHEHRAAINAFTLQKSYHGAKKLNDLGMPVYFIIGNHDLAFRNHRSTFTTEIFEPLENFILLSETTVVDEIHGKVLAIPYLREDEYPSLIPHADIPVAMGHLELQGFILTGVSHVKEHGPEAKTFFRNQKRVFTGHFHKRQTQGNVHYIGNTFPMDFSDVNDEERGMAVYDFVKDNLQYVNWPDGPRFIKATLTDVLDDPDKHFKHGARIKIDVDDDLTLEEANELRAVFQEKYSLREITLEEKITLDIDLTDIEEEIEELQLESTSEAIRELIKRIKVDKIDTDLLLKIYDNLSVVNNDMVAKASTIQFMEMSLRNFLSYGNSVTTIDLDFNDPTLIVGRNYDSIVDGQVDSNGAGKSSILNGLLMCLYDDNLMGVKKDAQINNSNGKNMMLTCTFKVNDVYYKVERYRKNKSAGGDGVRIYVNETEPVFDESHDKTPDSVDNANKFIAEKLGIPYEMFIRIVVFSATHKPFLSLPSSHASQANQRDIIEELFGLTELTSKADMLKEIMKNDKKDFTNLQATNEMIMAEHLRHMEQIHANEKRIKSWDEDHAEKVNSTKKNLEELEAIDLHDTTDSFEVLDELDKKERKIEKSLPVLQAELKNVQSLEARRIRWEEEHAQSMEALEKEIEKLESYDFAELRKNKEELNILQEEHTILTTNLRGMKRERDAFKASIRDIEANIKEQKTEIGHLGNQECPYCRQKYDEAKTKIHECEAQLSELETKLKDQLAELESSEEMIEETEGELEEIAAAIKKIEALDIPKNIDVLEHSLQTSREALKAERSKENPHISHEDDLSEEELIASIKTIENDIEQIHKQKKMAREFIHPSFKSLNDVGIHLSRIETLKLKLEELSHEKNPFLDLHDSLINQNLTSPKNAELNALDKKIKHQDFLVKLLTKKDSFIRKALLNKSIPLLNTRLRMYLDKIGLPHKVKFNEEMGVDISQFGSKYEYGQFSSGQKARINICLAFAFRDVLQSRFGKINLCILDECLDTGLGAVGVGLVAKMIKAIAVEHDLSMFVISHRDEVSTMFDKRLEIELRNGFSTIKEEES